MEEIIQNKMRFLNKVILLFCFVSFAFPSFAQVGVGTTSPDPSAILDIYAKDKGVLFPRLTKVERDLIKSPTEGLLIYQTNNTPGYYYYTGTKWDPIERPGGKLISSSVFNSATGILTLTYSDGTTYSMKAKGDKGDDGLSFKVDYKGPPTDRVKYDAAPAGTSFLDTQSGVLYFRLAAGGWSAGISFGRGEKGDKGDTGLRGPIGPQGLKGEKGEQGERGIEGLSFSPSKLGLFKDRDKYSSVNTPFFSYLSVDNGMIYFLESKGKWSAGIPFGRGPQGFKGNQGDKGDKGDKGDRGDLGKAFQPDTVGEYKNRSKYNLEAPGFAFLATDTAKIYFLESTGKWSGGIPFGKGDKGDSFSIDVFAKFASRTSYDDVKKDFTFYATDQEKLYFKTSTGWSSGIPLSQGIPGRSFTIDVVANFADRSTYDISKEGFVFYAKDRGEVYFKRDVGWSPGVPFSIKGDPFVINASGDFSNRAKHDSEDVGFVYYAEDNGEVYFREGSVGTWSPGYFFGLKSGKLPLGNIFIGDGKGLPKPQTVTGHLLLDDKGVAKISNGVLDHNHFKPLPASANKGELYIWDSLPGGWITSKTSDLYAYGLLDSLGLYRDSKGNLGKGTRVPRAAFDVIGDLVVSNRIRATHYVGTDTVSASQHLDVFGSAVFNESSKAVDFRIESDTEEHMFFVDGANSRLGIGTGTLTEMLTVDGSAVFNESSKAVDFRIESDVEEHMFFVDGANSRLGIGTGTPTEMLTVDGSAVFNESSKAVDFRIESDAEEHMFFVDGANSRLGIGTGTLTEMLTVDGSAVFNESSKAVDFRIESDTETHMFFVDGTNSRLGIGTGTPTEMLTVDGSAVFNESSKAVDFRIESDSDVNMFFVDGGSNRVGIGMLPTATFTVDGSAVFNESSKDADFRVESNTYSDMLYVDAGQNKIGIAMQPVSSSAVFNVDGSAIFNVDGEDHDFRVASDDDANMLFVDGGSNRVGIGMLPTATFTVDGSAVFNESSKDADFRVESNAYSDMLYIDGGQNKVGIAVQPTSSSAVFNVDGSAIFNVDREDHDFRVASDDETNMLFVDGGSNRVGIGMLPTATFTVDGSAVFNESSKDADFRVESNAYSDMLYVDAGQNKIGIAVQPTSSSAVFNVDGSAIFNVDGEDHDFRVASDDDANMLFVDGGNDRVGIGILPTATFTVDGSAVFNESSKDADFRVESNAYSDMLYIDGGQNKVGIAMQPTSSSAVFNVDGSAVFNVDREDHDFRVASDDETNMLFVDGGNDRVGIGTSSPFARLHVTGGERAVQFTKGSHYGNVAVAVATSLWNKKYNGNLKDQYYDRARLDGDVYVGQAGYYNPLKFDKPLSSNGEKRSGQKKVVARFDGSVVIHSGALAIATNSTIGISSDIRIKKDVKNLEAAESVDKLEQLRLVSYKLKDSLQHGGERFEGVLAQEVEKIDPAYVNYKSGYLPNIYAMSAVKSYEKEQVTLELSKLLGDEVSLAAGDRIKLYAQESPLKETELEVAILKVKTVRGKTQIQFHLPEYAREIDWSRVRAVFVYGKEVHDFRSVRYNKLYLLNLRVTQELIKQNKELLERVSELEKRVK